MYKDEMKVEPGNIYSKIIEQCNGEVRYIREKVSVITSHPILEECMADTPARTPLERELRDLLANLQDLKEKIVV